MTVTILCNSGFVSGLPAARAVGTGGERVTVAIEKKSEGFSIG